jgi:hypothetical protein
VQVALDTFGKAPTLKNLADYFSKLREAEENGEIGDDTFLNGLATVEEALWTFAKS